MFPRGYKTRRRSENNPRCPCASSTMLSHRARDCFAFFNSLAIRLASIFIAAGQKLLIISLELHRVFLRSTWVHKKRTPHLWKNFVVFTALALPAFTHLSAVAQTCPDNVPHITGTWTVLPYQMPINPISAHLLPNGKVLIVAGSENDAKNNSKGAESYRAAVWDPTGTNESSIGVQNLIYDVFCSGTAALFDGRSLIVGLLVHGRKPGFDLQSSHQPVCAVSEYGGWALVCDSDGPCRWSHYGHVRAHSNRRYKSNHRDL
jgi:hypothetical protein